MVTGDPRIIEDDVVIGIAADSNDPGAGEASAGRRPGHGNGRSEGDDVSVGHARRRGDPFFVDVRAARRAQILEEVTVRHFGQAAMAGRTPWVSGRPGCSRRCFR